MPKIKSIGSYVAAVAQWTESHCDKIAWDQFPSVTFSFLNVFS